MADTGGNRKADIRLQGKGSSNSHCARPVYQNNLDDVVDSDPEVVNKELSLSTGRRPHPPPEAYRLASRCVVGIENLYWTDEVGP